MSKTKILMSLLLMATFVAAGKIVYETNSLPFVPQEHVVYNFNPALLDTKPEQNIDPNLFQSATEISKELYRRAGNARGKLISLSDSICKKYKSCKVLVPDLKNFAVAEKKVTKEYNGDWNKITDIVRGSIVFSTLEELNRGIKDFNDSEFQIVYLKDRFKNPTKSGYRDINALFYNKENKVIGEIQFHLCHIVKIKNMEHRLYEAKRDIEHDASKEHRVINPTEQKVIQKLDLISKELYREAYNDASRGKNCNL